MWQYKDWGTGEVTTSWKAELKAAWISGCVCNDWKAKAFTYCQYNSPMIPSARHKQGFVGMGATQWERRQQRPPKHRALTFLEHLWPPSCKEFFEVNPFFQLKAPAINFHGILLYYYFIKSQVIFFFPLQIQMVVLLLEHWLEQFWQLL